MKIRYIILSFMLAFSFMLSTASYAKNVKVVSGVIESASGNSIIVNGNSYNLSGIPILNTDGRELSTSELKEGKTVDIFFRNNSVSSIVVYESNKVW